MLHPSLKKEKIKDKIIPISGLDARNLIPIKEKLDICTIDVTFASLRTILPNVKRVLKEDGDIIALVKPIFETEFHKEDKFDVIQDPNQIFEILKNLIQWNRENQIFTLGIIKSPILGKEGSLEFLIHLKLKKHTASFNFNVILKINLSLEITLFFRIITEDFTPFSLKKFLNSSFTNSRIPEHVMIYHGSISRS